MEIEYRPWGAYTVLHDTSEAKVKVKIGRASCRERV